MTTLEREDLALATRVRVDVEALLDGTDRAALSAAVAPRVSCSEAWEAAYARFETPEEEVRKFQRRLAWFGAEAWPRDARVVELFCGRGNGLVALERLGFERLEGVDLSASLLAQFRGRAVCTVADCRTLPHPDGSRDIAIVQGGLHHLEQLPEDLERVLSEIRRVLVPGGRFVMVEPWMTPMLAAAHAACASAVARRAWSKLDALAEMTEHERPTYEAWLRQPRAILAALDRHFVRDRARRRRGKLFFTGRARA